MLPVHTDLGAYLESLQAVGSLRHVAHLGHVLQGALVVPADQPVHLGDGTLFACVQARLKFREREKRVYKSARRARGRATTKDTSTST